MACIRMSVTSGPGVPSEYQERIFEPFYRLPGASERDGGMGLGLALVKSIALRHGGRVFCRKPRIWRSLFRDSTALGSRTGLNFLSLRSEKTVFSLVICKNTWRLTQTGDTAKPRHPLQFIPLLSQFTKFEAQPPHRLASVGSNDVPFGGLLQSHLRVAFFCALRGGYRPALKLVKVRV
jgi:hypothetical protein